MIAEYSGAALATVLTLFLGRRGNRLFKVHYTPWLGGRDRGEGVGGEDGERRRGGKTEREKGRTEGERSATED